MKCDACITGEAHHRRRARVSLDSGVIESTLDLCEICYAVANNLQDAVLRIHRQCPLQPPILQIHQTPPHRRLRVRQNRCLSLTRLRRI
jgi:hypothetical protein